MTQKELENFARKLNKRITTLETIEEAIENLNNEIKELKSL